MRVFLMTVIVSSCLFSGSAFAGPQALQWFNKAKPIQGIAAAQKILKPGQNFNCYIRLVQKGLSVPDQNLQRQFQQVGNDTFVDINEYHAENIFQATPAGLIGRSHETSDVHASGTIWQPNPVWWRKRSEIRDAGQGNIIILFTSADPGKAGQPYRVETCTPGAAN